MVKKPVIDVINKFEHIIITAQRWNIVLLLVKFGHVNKNIKSECFISDYSKQIYLPKTKLEKMIKNFWASQLIFRQFANLFF